MNRSRWHAMWAVLLLASGSVARGEVLVPGREAIVAGSGIDAAARPGLQGTVLEDITTPFSYEGWFRNDGVENGLWTGPVTGSLQTRVVRSIDGSIDLYWHLNVDTPAFLSVAAVSFGGGAPGVFDADWRTDTGPGVVPAWVRQGEGGGVTWFFGQYLPPSHLVYPGEQSVWFFLDTPYGAYGPGSFRVASERDSGGSMLIRWGGESAALPTFVPVATIPEPAHGSLLGLGGLVLLLWRRWLTGRKNDGAQPPTMRRCLPAPVPPTRPSRAISAPA